MGPPINDDWIPDTINEPIFFFQCVIIIELFVYVLP